MTELPRRCKLIYRPKGRALEFAALACNPYRGCGHGCEYCFGPQVLRMTRQEFHGSPRTRSAGFLTQLKKEAQLCREAGLRARVLLSFTTDIYQPIDELHRLSRSTIELLHAGGLNVAVLTKAGTRALADLDLYKPGDAHAATLTFTATAAGRELSKRWEPHAALPEDRLAALRAFHAVGAFTWASIEPVIDPRQSLAVIEQSAAYVDAYKMGPLNYHPKAKTVDWPAFARAALVTLDVTGKPYYIKQDLARHLGKTAGFWAGGPFCDCGTGDATHVSEHDPLCLFTEVERLNG